MALLLASTPLIAGSAVASPLPAPSPAVAATGGQTACPHGFVALTFDDGPDPTTTPQLARTLKAHGAGGTFFVVGALAGSHPDIIRQLRAEGMIVGNHSYDHPFLDGLEPHAVEEELQATNDILDGLAGPAPVLFRPPYGRTNATVETVARRMGMTQVLWTHDSDDYDHVPVAHLIEVARKAENGDILLFHDRLQSTVDALPRILADLTSRGICTGQIVPTTEPHRVWVEDDGDDRQYHFATTARW